MDKLRDVPSPIEADGLSIMIDGGWLAASLRYFDAQGSFAAILRSAVGAGLPEPLRAIQAVAPASPVPLILIWRSPTETLLLSKDPPAFARLEDELAAAADGCMVNQTGGLCMVRVQGRRTDDLLTRLGATSAIPGIGEACTGRFAELQATAVRLAEDAVLLIVERVYVDHLLEWIAVTARDL
jgi:heterotetrameric sarcosine oxidase gamma subunit